MGMFDPRTKVAARAFFARERPLVDRIAANPDDAGAILKLCRLQIRGDRPLKALARINGPAIQLSQDADIHRQACEALIEIGAFEPALRQATRGLALGDDARLAALHAEASRLLAQDQACGIDPALKQTYLVALQHLLHGEFCDASALFEQLVAAAPRFAPAWIGLRGALEARGDKALADRWIAADPASAPVARIVMARRLHGGLIFNRLKSMPIRAMREALHEVRSLEALDAQPKAFLPLDPGGQDVTLDPVISRRADGADRIVLNHKTPEVFLAAIDNAAVVGRGLVIDAVGEMVRELHGPNLGKYGMVDDGERVTFDPTTLRSWLGEVKVHDTPALLMAGASDRSFGDWMLIYLPRLAIARAAGLRCPVVVSAHAPPPFLELLRQLGLSDDEIILHDPHGVSLFRKLYVPSWPLRDYLAPMSGLFEIYRGLAVRGTSGSRRIYLSRERVARREIVNEAELSETLQRHGFEVIHPQELSLTQMRRLLADVDYVAAPYGSALLNLAMAGQNPKVLVCVPPLKGGFLRQAVMWMGSMGLQLAYVQGRQVGGDLGELGMKDAAWRVSIPEVERALASILP